MPHVCLLVFMDARELLSLFLPQLFPVSRSVWFKKRPMTSTPALLNLLDAPWSAMLHFTVSASPGRGTGSSSDRISSEIGFAWDSEQAGCNRARLPLFTCDASALPGCSFQSLARQGCHRAVSADRFQRRFFFWLWERNKMMLRAIFLGMFGTVTCSVKQRNRVYRVFFF